MIASQGVTITNIKHLLNFKYINNETNGNTNENENEQRSESENQNQKQKLFKDCRLDLHMEEDEDLIIDHQKHCLIMNDSNKDPGKISNGASDDMIIESILARIIDHYCQNQNQNQNQLGRLQKEEINSFEQMLSENPILRLARKIFYEGQVEDDLFPLFFFLSLSLCLSLSLFVSLSLSLSLSLPSSPSHALSFALFVLQSII